MDNILTSLENIEKGEITDVYIGLTSFIIAILILIVETIQQNKNEFYKKFILYEIDIVGLSYFMFLIFIFIIISNVIEPTTKNIWSYMIFQTVLDCCILASMVQTLWIFGKIIVLNTQKQVKDEKLKKYIEHKMSHYEDCLEKLNKGYENKIKKDNYKVKIKVLRDVVILNEAKKPTNNLISSTIEQLIQLEQNENNFDKEGKLVEFYKFLCNNKFNNIINIFMKKIEEEISKKYTNRIYNNGLVDFLKSIRKITYENKNQINSSLDYFKKINLYITSLYINELKDTTDETKKIIYSYAIKNFNCIYFQVKNDEKFSYDCIKNLLIIMNVLTKSNYIDEIGILLDNIDFSIIIADNFNKELNITENLAKFQFLIGWISIILYSYDAINKKALLQIKKIFKDIGNSNIFYYDTWHIILAFIKYYIKANTEIKDWIVTLSPESKNKYQKFKIYEHISDIELLKYTICMLSCRDNNLNEINKNDIDESDKDKIKNLINIISENRFKKVEKIFKFDENRKDNIKKILNEVIT